MALLAVLSCSSRSQVSPFALSFDCLARLFRTAVGSPLLKKRSADTRDDILQSIDGESEEDEASVTPQKRSYIKDEGPDPDHAAYRNEEDYPDLEKNLKDPAAMSRPQIRQRIFAVKKWLENKNFDQVIMEMHYHKKHEGVHRESVKRWVNCFKDGQPLDTLGRFS